MAEIKARLEKIGIGLPEVLLPKTGTDLSKWSVVACDQFSSERHYWEKAREIVGGAPSTLRLILPECYLEDGDTEARVQAINAEMRAYLENILRPLEAGFVLIDRKTAHAPSRKGLVLAVDLEAYSFEAGAASLIRPTEGTILKRLPPRMAIRRGATLDLPHILLLLDDPDRTVVEPLFSARKSFRKLYEFELMQDGGSITGWHVPAEALGEATSALEKLASGGFLFAVGDGNHSLAAAKSLWEERKSAGAAPDDPARWALVEVENIHDEGLHFHPIHRVLFGLDAEAFFSEMAKALGGWMEVAPAAPAAKSEEGRVIEVVSEAGLARFVFNPKEDRMTVEFFQEFLDAYLAKHGEVSIDYIHGEEAVREMGSKPGNAGFYMPPLDKSVFFTRMVEVGPYPRKTFSIGEATEKRYYLESRKLVR
ncbi:MAG: DUF1015 domain-containing protein [Synergistales bacterium]|jgi:hypothetical protein